MFSRILTTVERRKIQAYLKHDGEKDMHMRVIATRVRQFMPQIKEDIQLLERLLTAYEKRSPARK